MSTTYKGTLTPEQQETVLNAILTGRSVRATYEDNKAEMSYGQVRGYSEYLAKKDLEKSGGPPPEEAPMPSLPVVVFDLETTSLDTFFGRLIVGCFMDINTEEMVTKDIHDFQGSVDEKETQLLHWATDEYEKGFVLVGHNITGFDRGFLQGRHDNLGTGRIINQALHFDTMQIARHQAKVRAHGNSLKNLLDYYQLPVQKDEPSKHEWARTRELDPVAIKRIRHRCEEDVRGNALLAGKLLPHVRRGPGIKSYR